MTEEVADVASATASIRANDSTIVAIAGDITDEQAEALVSALESNTVLGLFILDYVRASPKSLHSLMCTLSRKPLRFRCNDIGDNDYHALMASLIGPGSLILSVTAYDASALLLSGIISAMRDTPVPRFWLNGSVTVQSAEGNKLTCGLTEVLRVNPAVRHVEMSWNMTEDSLNTLAEVVKTNTRLTTLYIDCRSSQSSALALAKMMRENSSLRNFHFRSTGNLSLDVLSELTDVLRTNYTVSELHWSTKNLADDVTQEHTRLFMEAVSNSSLNHLSIWPFVFLDDGSVKELAVARAKHVFITDDIKKELVSVLSDSSWIDSCKSVSLFYLRDILLREVESRPDCIDAVIQIVVRPELRAASLLSPQNREAWTRLYAAVLAKQTDAGHDNELTDALDGYPYKDLVPSSASVSVCLTADDNQPAKRLAVESSGVLRNLSQESQEPVQLPLSGADVAIILEPDVDAITRRLKDEWCKRLEALLQSANYLHAPAALNALVHEYAIARAMM